jgi:hypothetical protein
MPDTGRCPRERPYWCAHPHCLHCNFDDRQGWPASALAAFVAAPSAGPRGGAGTVVREGRSYVAWLCRRCVRDAVTLRWFLALVRREHPGAQVVINPGLGNEAPVPVRRRGTRRR